MIYKDIAKEIIELRNADFELRQTLIANRKLSKGYDKEMANLHNKNADVLNEIINRIGYPTIDKVGLEAYEAAWLVIQHTIERPNFLKRCAHLLGIAVNEEKASAVSLAYLTDRIAVLEGKPQLFGTQFDWDESGELSPNFYDSLRKVNERRESIGLNMLKEQTAKIRKQAKEENQTPPKDLNQRKNEIDKWRKKVDWKND